MSRLMSIRDTAAFTVINRYKKLIIAFFLIAFLFVLGEITVETFFSEKMPNRSC